MPDGVRRGRAEALRGERDASGRGGGGESATTSTLRGSTDTGTRPRVPGQLGVPHPFRNAPLMRLRRCPERCARPSTQRVDGRRAPRMRIAGGLVVAHPRRRRGRRARHLPRRAAAPRRHPGLRRHAARGAARCRSRTGCARHAGPSGLAATASSASARVVAGLIWLVVGQVRAGFPTSQERSAEALRRLSRWLLDALQSHRGRDPVLVDEVFGQLRDLTDAGSSTAPLSVGSTARHVLAGRCSCSSRPSSSSSTAAASGRWIVRLFPRAPAPAVAAPARPAGSPSRPS